MRTFSARIQKVGVSSYAVRPLADFEAWRTEYGRLHPKCADLLSSAVILRRIVQLRLAGDNFAEIGRCCGLSRFGAKNAFERLPEDLRASTA